MGDIVVAVAPHNLEAEQALLGVLLYDNAAYERLTDSLQGRHFYEPFHQRLFGSIETHIRKGQLAEPILLADEFKHDPAFEELGGLRYLADLVDRAPPAANVGDYARAVFDLALRRDLIRIGGEIASTAHGGVGKDDVKLPARDQIEAAEQQLYTLAESGTASSGFVSFGDALRGAVEMTAEAYSRDGGMSGLATDLIDLDTKIGGLHPSDLIVLAGRPSMGKAQPLEARIKTTTGWTRMGDLRLGDELASIDGQPSRVTGLYPQGEKEIYRLTFSDGRSAEACAEHLWQVHYRGWERPRVLTTAAIIVMLERKRYQGRLWVDPCSGHFGHSQTLPVDPWVLGALLGDGNLKGGSPRFSTASETMLEELSDRLGETFELRAAGGYDWRVVQVGGAHRTGVQGVNPNPLKQALAGLGLWEVGSPDKFIPDLYLTAHRQARLDLLRGLLDTDGWVETWGSIRFASTSERLARGVVELARSLGGWATIRGRSTSYRQKGELKAGLSAWTVNIYHPSPETLFTVPEKVARLSASPRRRRMPVITSVSPSRTAEAQCITVSHPSRLYVTDDYVVTHNTALATNIAFNVAKKYAWEPQPDGTKKTVSGGVVAFYSLEMSAEQLALRMLADASGVSGDKLRKGEIDASEFGRVRDAAIELQEAPLYIDATGGISIAKLTARARRLKRQVGLDLIVVDYLQLVTGSDLGSNANRVQEVSQITMGLKALAKELACPVIALSQLSRQVEQREDKRPQLSDLRESGSIEQDADMVWFVYRESYYVGRSEPREGTPEHLQWQEDMDRLQGLAEVIIAKQRHGPIGTVRLSFNSDTTRFGNLARDHYFHQMRSGSDE